MYCTHNYINKSMIYLDINNVSTSTNIFISSFKINELLINEIKLIIMDFDL